MEERSYNELQNTQRWLLNGLKPILMLILNIFKMYTNCSLYPRKKYSALYYLQNFLTTETSF